MLRFLSLNGIGLCFALIDVLESGGDEPLEGRVAVCLRVQIENGGLLALLDLARLGLLWS